MSSATKGWSDGNERVADMPLNVNEVSAEVALFDGELPFSEAQIEHLVTLVARRLAVRAREEARRNEATTIRDGVTPSMGIGE